MSMTSEKAMLLVPVMVISTTAYVACSSEDSASSYDLRPDDAGLDTMDATRPDATQWPGVSEDTIDDAPVSGAG